MSSLSQPPFSRHDFACSNFSFLFKAKFVVVVTWTCWKLKFLLRPQFCCRLISSYFFLNLSFCRIFLQFWNLSQLLLFCKQFSIILIINLEKWIKNLVSFWTHQIPPNLKFFLSPSKEKKKLFVLKQISLENF